MQRVRLSLKEPRKDRGTTVSGSTECCLSIEDSRCQSDRSQVTGGKLLIGQLAPWVTWGIWQMHISLANEYLPSPHRNLSYRPIATAPLAHLLWRLGPTPVSLCLRTKIIGHSHLAGRRPVLFRGLKKIARLHTPRNF